MSEFLNSALHSKPVNRVLERLYRASEEVDPVMQSHAHKEVAKIGAESGRGFSWRRI